MCYYCGEALPASPKIGFSETCPSCGKDLHVCLHCSFYLIGAHWDCRETIDALVAEKDKRNFCEWFGLDARYGVKNAGLIATRGKAESAKSAFDALFTK